MSSYVYYQGLTTGPAMALSWYDRDGSLRDFSSGYTFVAKLVEHPSGTTVVEEKTSGITGAATAPNVVVDWATADHNALTTGKTYKVIVVATPSGGDPIAFKPGEEPTITILAAPTGP